MRILRARLPAGACRGPSAGPMFRGRAAGGSPGRVCASTLHDRSGGTGAERDLKETRMSTQLVDDRKVQVEGILSAFDLPVGGTFSGVAYGGRFIESGSGAAIETRDPSTGTVLAHIRSASEADCSSAIAAAQEAFKSWRSVPAPKRG
ncbi:MAG TPA: hypothetical protein DCK96_01445, partial [Chloroflexi bacterium]|nr:hypothetical protein [Chloroflexota bacterium]